MSRWVLCVVAALAVTLARCPLHAASESYRECDVFNGQRSFCGSWYTGKAVVHCDGAYRESDIFNGQLTWCGTWYKGKVVAFRDGAYRSCDVFNGQITFCGAWYQGKAVLLVP